MGWGVISGVGLVAASFIDPYIFGLAAFTAAGLSGLLALFALLLARAQLLWATASALPTALSFVVLSTYKWA